MKQYSTEETGKIFLGIGGSIGLLLDQKPLDHVTTLLAASGITVRACSRLWRTPAWHFPAASPSQRRDQDPGDFWNAVMEIVPPDPCANDPLACLALLHAVERAAGRDRENEEKWGTRRLDLDILDWRGEIHVSTEADGLHLPHLFLDSRPFVLGPLADIAPDWHHPVLGLRAAELAERLPPDGGYPLPSPEINPQ